MKSPVRVAVTGAAGQIGYSLLFRIAAGEMLGKDQPIILQLLEIPQALRALEGVIMELEDCAFPLLQGLVATDDPKVAFKDADYALLVGAAPRKAGMERRDLLEMNGKIFTEQGRALAEVAKRDVKVLVVGNPANTNALIAYKNAPGLNPRNFTAMTRLDHNRAKAQLAKKTGVPVDRIRRIAVWGNHSSTMFPDLFHAEVEGQPALERVEMEWYEKEFIPTVAQRGAAIIQARGPPAPPAPPTPPLSTSATGPWAPRKGTGSPWPCPPKGSTASPRGSSTPSPSRPRAGSTGSWRASRSTPSPASGWRSRPKSSWRRWNR